MVDENIEFMKTEREKKRVNLLLELIENCNGELRTQQIAEAWNIPPERVEKYLGYLMRKYEIPIESQERGYPVYKIPGKLKLKYHEVEFEDEEKVVSEYMYPSTKNLRKYNSKRDRSSKDDKKLIICDVCGNEVETGQFCGICGSNL